MKKTIFPLLIFLLLTINFSLFGQNSESPNSRLNVLESLAKTNDRETKMLALESLKELIDQGMTGDSSERILELLTILANEGITNITYEGMKRGLEFPQVRTEAATLLGETKDERALNPLVNIIFYDNNSQTIIAAIQALSLLEPDNDGKMATAFARILKNTRLIYNNEELIQFTLEAVAASAPKNANIFNNQDIIEGLEFVSQSSAGYGRKTRKRAEEVMDQANRQDLTNP
jgi:hypothetical protein